METQLEFGSRRIGIPLLAIVGIEGLTLREVDTPSRMSGGQVHAPPLIEAEGADVVVGGDQPDPTNALVASVAEDGVHQRTSNAAALRFGLDGHDLKLVVANRVGDQADALLVSDGDEAGERNDIDKLTLAGDGVFHPQARRSAPSFQSRSSAPRTRTSIVEMIAPEHRYSSIAEMPVSSASSRLPWATFM